MLIEEVAGLDQLLLQIIARHEQNAVLHITIWSDDNQQHPLVGQTDEFNLPEGLRFFRRQHHTGKLRQIRQQGSGRTDRAVRLVKRQILTKVACIRPLETLGSQETIHKQAVALGRGNTPRRGMGAMNQAQAFQLGHHITDCGRGKIKNGR
jgi:hypothetical protein